MAGFCNKWFLVFNMWLAVWWIGYVDCLEEAHSVVNAHGICGTFVWDRGYDCTEFIVPTKDGFLLAVQKMSNRTLGTSCKEPVFLHHGVMEGGESWLLNEPKQSLAFMLVDSGYDVWIGNARTTMFSYGHTTYTREQKEFWDWNWDDLVDYDLPAMLQFVNNMTGQPIYYVGYSQGAMSGFAAFTDNEISSLVKKAAMLSPVAYLNHVSSPIARAAAWLFVDKVDMFLGMYEFNLSSASGRQLLQTTCKIAQLNYQDSDLSALITGPSCCTNKSMTAYYDKYTQSTSIKNMAQMAQLLRSGRFGKYDYGFIGNLLHYWRISPPSYDLSAIPESLSFFLAHGGKDMLADAEDVTQIAEKLPGQVKMLLMPNYNHGDMMLATSAHTDVFPRILEFFH